MDAFGEGSRGTVVCLLCSSSLKNDSFSQMLIFWPALIHTGGQWVSTPQVTKVCSSGKPQRPPARTFQADIMHSHVVIDVACTPDHLRYSALLSYVAREKSCAVP